MDRHIPCSSCDGRGCRGTVAIDRSRSGVGMRGDLATAAVHTVPGPVGGDPAGDGVCKWDVEGRSVGPHPGLHRDVPFDRGGGVEVDATDDVAVAWIENREGETDAPSEVVSVAAKVGEVLLEGHAVWWWPVAVGIAGSRANVPDARRPGGMIRLVVLRAQGLQPELVGGERGRCSKADWHELIRGHDRDRTSLAGPAALEFFPGGRSPTGHVMKRATIRCQIIKSKGTRTRAQPAPARHTAPWSGI